MLLLLPSKHLTDGVIKSRRLTQEQGMWLIWKIQVLLLIQKLN